MAFDIIPWNPLQYQAESDRIIYSSKKKKKKISTLYKGSCLAHSNNVIP
jgi:hypothetical protein